MESNETKIRIVVMIDGEIDDWKREQILETLRANLRNYLSLDVQVEAELLG